MAKGWAPHRKKHIMEGGTPHMHRKNKYWEGGHCTYFVDGGTIGVGTQHSLQTPSIHFKTFSRLTPKSSNGYVLVL